jgi:pimeloyl-ACP methyl ester carboxylesterase
LPARPESDLWLFGNTWDDVMADAVQRITSGSGADLRRLAMRQLPGKMPAILWFGGFRSDMTSTKAAALEGLGRETGHAVVRMDYAGHGESEGSFEDCTLSTWIEDAETVLMQAVDGPAVIVGSSMGGWIALAIAKRLFETGRRGRIAGLVLIAPAVDFTEALMWAQFPQSIRDEVMTAGRWERPSAYSEQPYPITRALIEDGRKHILYGAPFRVGCPVHILQGGEDPDVPAAHALKLVEHLPLDPVTVSLIPDGNHRLSRDEDIAMLIEATRTMIEQAVR